MKTILITGVTSGIGLETAKFFKAKGYKVIGISRREVKDPKEFFCDKYYSFDLENYKSINQFVELKGINEIDILVNNAGMGYFIPLEETELEMEERVLNLNLRAPIELTKTLLPKINPGGSVVNISSVAGKRAFKNLSVYCASKFGLIGFSNSLRRELKFCKKDIHVGVVCPPATRTNFFNNAGYFTFEEDHPVLSMADPRLVAEEIWKCVKHKKREVTVTFRAKLFDKLASIFPGFIEWLEDKVSNSVKK